MTLRVLDPRLPAEGEALEMARPLEGLRGTTIGLLDNAKIGTARFYDYLEQILRERYRVGDVIRRRKPDSSRPASPDILGALRGADAIVSGIGD